MAVSAPRSYATLAQLRQRNSISNADTADDARLLSKLRAASKLIDDWTARSFQPFMGTYVFDYADSGYQSFNDYDCLSVSSIVDGSGRTINPAAIVPMGATGTGASARGWFYGVRIDPTKDFITWLFTRERCIQVTGVWGTHDNYPDAWNDTGVTGTVADTTNTTITTTNYLKADPYGRGPAISPGQLIAIDYSAAGVEWCHVITAPTSTDITFTAQPNDGDTLVFTVNGVVYTYTLKTTPTAANHIQIGATLLETISNVGLALIGGAQNAISATNASGPYYTGTLPLPMNVSRPQTASLTLTVGLTNASSAVTVSRTGTAIVLSNAGFGTSITVSRAANGSTPNTHSSGVIYAYSAPASIAEACARWASLLWSQDDTTYGMTTITALGTTIPAGIPADLRQALEPWRKILV